MFNVVFVHVVFVHVQLRLHFAAALELVGKQTPMRQLDIHDARMEPSERVRGIPMA